MSHIDIRRLDMTALLVFAELMKGRKLTLAAERLGLTQSAVSHALGRLREAFDDPLFIRRSTGVEPTMRALAMEPKISAMLDLAREALAPPARFDPAAARRDFRIIAPDLDAALLAPCLAEAAREAPGLRFAFLALGRGAALAALESGDADLAIGVFPESASPHLTRFTLYEEGYAVAAPPDHPAARAGMTLAAYAAADHALVSQAGDFRGVVDSALEKQGLKRRVAFSAAGFFAALATARTGLLLTAPRRFLEAHAPLFGLRVFDAPLETPRFQVSALRHARTVKDPALDWLLEGFAQGL